MRYRVMQAHAGRYPLRLMCRTLTVSSAGYSAWRVRPESTRAVANRQLQKVRRSTGMTALWYQWGRRKSVAKITPVSAAVGRREHRLVKEQAGCLYPQGSGAFSYAANIRLPFRKG